MFTDGMGRVAQGREVSRSQSRRGGYRGEAINAGLKGFDDERRSVVAGNVSESEIEGQVVSVFVLQIFDGISSCAKISRLYPEGCRKTYE